MGNDIAISVEGLSKCYRVGHQTEREQHATLRDQIVRHAKGFARKARDMASGQAIVQGDTVEDFWALRDVTFDIGRGARVGILGRNGAGKSTLLKVLSRITEPTSGLIKINGRVASLLEVGTGFHPELTGRENIFLNGAILGMSRREIQAKFDEIVAFAEVERFLDTPVKRYSSGMYVRLAFAVAAHLESEILIVDEVLAVGDSQFQQKCLGKMGAVSQDGRTVLFVSHNIDAIRTLCTSAVLLKSGSFVAAGGVQPIVNQYLASVRQSSRSGAGVWHTPEPRIGVNTVRVIQRGIESSQLICGESFELRIDVKLDETCSDLEIGFGFRDEEGRDILCVNNKHVDQTVDWPRHGDFEVVIHVPQLNWIHGTEVSLGIYFGYVNGRYQALEDIMFLRLSKEFQVLSPAKLTPRENKIFIDGLNFTGASSDSSQFAAISAP